MPSVTGVSGVVPSVTGVSVGVPSVTGDSVGIDIDVDMAAIEDEAGAGLEESEDDGVAEGVINGSGVVSTGTQEKETLVLVRGLVPVRGRGLGQLDSLHSVPAGQLASAQLRGARQDTLE